MSLIADYQAAALARACIAFWPLTEGDGTAADATGHGHDGSGGPAATVTGPDHSTLVQSGDGATAITVSPDTAFPTGNDPFSVDFLFLLAEATESSTTIFVDWGSASDGEVLRIGGSGGPGLFQTFWGDDTSYNVPGGTFGGTWHQGTLTWDGTTRTLYFDGVQVLQDTPTGIDITLSGALSLLGAPDGGAAIQAGDGLCCVGVYSECLPSGFIASQYAILVDGGITHPTISGIATTRTRGLGAIYVFGALPRTMSFPIRYLNGSGRPMVGAVWQGQVSGIAEGQALRHLNGDILEPFSDPATTDNSGIAILTVIPPGDMVPENTTWLFTVTGGVAGE